MKRHSIIAHTLLVNKTGLTETFQLRIPREVDHICGVRIGYCWKNGAYPVLPAVSPWQLPMQQHRNLVLGEIKLQSYEQANVFYCNELAMNYNLDYGDYSTFAFQPKEYSHHAQPHIDEVTVSNSATVIQGFYRDLLFQTVPEPYKYEVRLYLWAVNKNTPIL